jgi:hypothetical protein
MTTLASTPTIPFHRRNSPVLSVTAYTFTDEGDAVLIHIAEGHPQGTGSYHFVSYCQGHEVAWDPSDFGVCPICNPEKATQREAK